MFPLIAFHAIWGLCWYNSIFFIFLMYPKMPVRYFSSSLQCFLSIFTLLLFAWHPLGTKTSLLPETSSKRNLKIRCPERKVVSKPSFSWAMRLCPAQINFSDTQRVALRMEKKTRNFHPSLFFVSPHVKPLGVGWKFNFGSLGFVSCFRANKRILELYNWIVKGLDRFDPVIFL